MALRLNFLAPRVKNSRSEASWIRAFGGRKSVEMIWLFFKNNHFLKELFRLRCVKISDFDLLRRRIGFQGTAFYSWAKFSFRGKLRKIFLGKIFIPRKAIFGLFVPGQIKKRRGKLISVWNRWIRDMAAKLDFWHFCQYVKGLGANLHGAGLSRDLGDKNGAKMIILVSDSVSGKSHFFPGVKGQKGSEGTWMGTWRDLAKISWRFWLQTWPGKRRPQISPETAPFVAAAR